MSIEILTLDPTPENAKALRRFVSKGHMRDAGNEHVQGDTYVAPSEDEVALQIQKIKESPSQYYGARFSEEGVLLGALKAGPWLEGDMAPFVPKRYRKIFKALGSAARMLGLSEERRAIHFLEANDSDNDIESKALSELARYAVSVYGNMQMYFIGHDNDPATAILRDLNFEDTGLTSTEVAGNPKGVEYTLYSRKPETFIPQKYS